MKKLFLVLFCSIFVFSGAFADTETRLLHEPDINGELIIFVYAGDIWKVSSDGGEATRLTSHAGIESTPKFSPDGKWVAFTGQYDGNTDVFIVPVEGGTPKRLTYHPTGDSNVGWTRNSDKVLFRSTRKSYSFHSRLFSVDINSGIIDEYPMQKAEYGCFSPDGRHMAYNPIGRLWQDNWRRYRGGQTPPIWLLDMSDYTYTEIPHENASDLYPVWMNDTVYFVSDRNRTMNLFGYNVLTGEVNELVHHDPFDIKNLSGDNSRLIYECNGDIYFYNPGEKNPVKLSVNVQAEKLSIRPFFKNVSSEVSYFGLSPSGVRALFSAHGEILTVPAKKGNIRNLSRSTGVNDRFPAWSPDGEKIAYFSDKSGEYALYITDQKAEEPEIAITLKDPVFYYNPSWSPDSKKIVYYDSKWNIWYIDIEDKKPVKVDTDKYFWPERLIFTDWSPDSKWIVYTKKLDNYFKTVFVYSIEEKKSYQITDGMSEVSSPVFDPGGKYLYFLASTDLGPTRGWLDLSSINRVSSTNIYLAVLKKEDASPFEPESDEEEPEEETEEKEEAEEKEESEEEENDFRIDIDNISQRIITLPVEAGTFDQLSAVEGALFYIKRDPLNTFRPGTLQKFDIKERKADDFLSGVNRFTLSSDGKKLLYNSQRDWGIVGTGGKPKPGDGKLDLSSMEVYVEPKAEWKQMLNEAWRLHRDFFYDGNMHGVDWDNVLEHYTSLLPYVAHRGDLNFLISEMVSEICVGHAYVRGGNFPEIERVPGGLLGADYEIVNGRYRIKKIYSGLNWNPDLRAPLTEPGVEVSEGDYIIKVNGRDLRSTTNIYSMFQKTAGKNVTLEVNSNPTEEGSRKITVVPITNEGRLRSRDWVEGNRKKVEELSEGRLGYIYLPNTADGGYNYFNRYFYSQLGKEGLVIDERFNGGGFAADYIIDLLDRPLLNYWVPRYGEKFTTPYGAVFGPKAMIINEYAGSGGDAMPSYFRQRSIGPLVGKRTWGGLVGFGGTPGLLDGGRIAIPNFAYLSPEGEWSIENEGIPPDIEVEMTPKDVISGHDPQLEKTVEILMEMLKDNPLKKLKLPKPPIRK